MKRRAQAALSSAAYQYRLNRLDAVNENIVRTCNALYKTELKVSRQFLGKEARKSYQNVIFDLQKGTGVSGAFDMIPQSRIDQILKRPWCGANYSKRIWGNTQKMADGLKRDLLAGLLTGKSEQEMVETIADRCHTSFFNARRLVRTETSYISCQAELEGFKEAGVERYEFSAVLDSGTSQICRSLDGKVFPIADAQPGTNFPPMHPWCRSVPVPVLPDEEELDRRWSESADELGLDLPFNEWVKHLQTAPDGKMRYVKDLGGALDKSAGSGIIKVGSEGVATKINDDLKIKELVKLGTNLHNRNQVIYEYSQRVKPCAGFEDIFIHGTPDYVFVDGNENDEFSFTADKFSEILRNSKSYSGGNIRLVACQTGAKEGGFAQQLANIMQVSVLAPTEVVNMDGRGNLFVTDNEIVADIWYAATDEEHAKMKETGKWILFKPSVR